ncbi:MAG: STAS domain-containing protein, partial [Candidatus Omnitrophica bacterium]|nr:STAS domain-containing protein [Candidatus Omnitrophota bacterium]
NKRSVKRVGVKVRRIMQGVEKNVKVFHIKDIFRSKNGNILSYIKEVKEIDGLAVVRLKGTIDSRTIPGIRANIGSRINKYLDMDILLDFKEVTRVDSAALASLIQLLNELKKRNRKLGIVNMTSVLREYLKITNLESAVQVYKSQKNALDDLLGGYLRNKKEAGEAKRILFLTTSVGSGHKRAAEAVQAALDTVSRKPLKTQTDTYFDYFLPAAEKVAAKVYVKTIQLMRQVLKYVYNVQKKDAGRKPARHFLSIPLIKRYEKAIRSFNPDAIVCTQALSSRFTSILKENGKISAPLIAVVTDFDIHPYWFNEYVDRFIVPTDEIKKELTAFGIAADRVYVFGIPIHPVFSKRQNKPALKKKLGLIGNLPVILIMGGGWGLGPIKKAVAHLDKSGMNLQLIVVAGKNRALKKELDKILPKLKVSLKVYGYVSNIDEFMEVSDIAVTKPGGLISSELLAKGLPAILVDVIPGQEEANGEYLISKGAACKIEKINQLQDTIQGLLENPARLEQMGRKAKAVAKPRAAVKSAGLIMDTVIVT